MRKQDKALRWLAALNRPEEGAIDAAFSSELVTHFKDTLLAAQWPGLAGLRDYVGFLRRAFPNLNFAVQSAASQGRTFAYTWAARGTHQGPFMRVQATGREVAFPGRFVLRYGDDDKVVELWSRTSLMSLMGQLGMAPGAKANMPRR